MWLEIRGQYCLRAYESPRKYPLIIFTPRDLASQVSLLVVQVLQLQVQRVDFLPRFAGFLLGAAHAQDGFAVQAAEVREVGVEFLLLHGEF